MKHLLAIDPGDVHVGMALFEGDRCIAAWEVDPDECVRYVASGLTGHQEPSIDTLVVEKFVLYPWMAQQQSFSEFHTVELIGVLKYIHRAAANLAAKDGKEPPVLELQPATIKDPTRNILRGKGVVSVAKRDKAGNHAADAELHGYYYLLRETEQDNKKKKSRRSK